MRINRDNYLLARKFLDYQAGHRQLDKGSVNRYWCDLKHVLRWLGPAPFNAADSQEQEFVDYLLSLQSGKAGPDPAADYPLATATVKKTVQTVKRFLVWGKLHAPQEFKELSPAWIEDLCAPKATDSSPDHIYVTFDEILHIARYPLAEDDLVRQRDRAGLVLLFLSGMRIGALGSLPLQAVDLSKQTIRQWPKLGVQTKNNKTATTYLLDIPELFAIVEKWDTFVRQQLPPTAMWYTPLISQWGQSTLSPEAPGEHRNEAIIKRTRLFYELAGLPYKSPHKLRHGHVVYALLRVKNMAEYKAVSQNIMHDDIKTTDGIYAPFQGDEVQAHIANLSRRADTTVEPNGELRDYLQQLKKTQQVEALHILAEELAR